MTGIWNSRGVERHAVSLDWAFPDGGKLDFLSAGRQNRDYSAAVCSLDWDNFYDRLGGGQFFHAMREDMKQKYDYVLIDSRTGLSDVADICTIELPDVLTICFTLSDQSIEGAANVARQISGRYRDRNIRVLPVPMRIEDGEKEKLDVGRALARMKFEGFPAGMTPESSAMYWAAVEIPYKPFYAFEETLATFGDEPGSPASLLAAFERITDAVTGGHVSAMRPIAEDLRLQYKDAFARRQPASSTEVYLSYVPEDRMWADWIEAVLTRAGFRVLPRSTVLTAGGGDGDARGSIQAERELRGAPRHRRAVRRVPAFPGRQVPLEDAVGGGRRRHAPPADPRPGQRDPDHRAIHRASGGRPGQDGRGPGDREAALGPRPARAARRQDGHPGRGAEIPGHDPAGLERAGQERRLHRPRGTLELLRDKLVGGGRAVVVAQALYGLGGVGKTQLALEYAHRFMADYDLVWWVPAERAEETSRALADLARKWA